MPPQPSSPPAHLPVQFGVQQRLVLSLQTCGVVQSSLPLQPQELLMQSLFCERTVQSVQLDPQCAAVLQVVQVPLLHHWPEGHEPVQVPPQPSSPPAHLPVQFGVQQRLVLSLQTCGVVQSSLPLQPQVPPMQSLFCV